MYIVIYHYREVTGEYLKSGTAPQDPRNPARWLIPAYATDIEPPEGLEGYARCFISGQWVQVEDHRGQTMYSIVDAQENSMLVPGPVPPGYTLLLPCEYPVWVVDHWEVNQEEKAKAESEQLKSDAQSELTHSDITVIRCYEHAVAVPLDWVDYRQTLRDIIDGLNPGPIPDRPPYPPGT